MVGEAFLLQSSVLEEVEVGVMGTELLLLPATVKINLINIHIPYFGPSQYFEHLQT